MGLQEDKRQVRRPILFGKQDETGIVLENVELFIHIFTASNRLHVPRS